MSTILEPNKMKNPAELFIEWSGSKGVFSFWDSEKKQRIEMPSEFTFYPVAELNTVTGFDKKNNCGIYSNEVHQYKDTLNVKSYKGGEIASGTWSDIKGAVESKGGKYCRSVYACIEGKSGWRLVNIKFATSALGSWIDHVKKFGVYNKGVRFYGTIDVENGSVKYKAPSLMAVSRDNDHAILEKAKLLSDYLEQYLQPKVENLSLNELTPETPVNMEPVESVGPIETDLPF